MLLIILWSVRLVCGVRPNSVTIGAAVVEAILAAVLVLFRTSSVDLFLFRPREKPSAISRSKLCFSTCEVSTRPGLFQRPRLVSEETEGSGSRRSRSRPPGSPLCESPSELLEFRSSWRAHKTAPMERVALFTQRGLASRAKRCEIEPRSCRIDILTSGSIC